MTVRPEDQPMDLEDGREEMKGKPRRGQADDGKSGGQSQGGQPGQTQFDGQGGAGTNAQRGGPSGTESDRDAPGAATHKDADDIK